MGSGEVQVDGAPECSHRFGSEMRAKDALRGQSDLQLLALFVVAAARFGGGILGRGLFVGWCVRHAQVGADHVHDDLTLLRGVLRQAF